MKNLLLRICALFSRRPTLGHVEAIPNRDHQLGECDFYLRVPVVEAGQRSYLLLTPSQFSVARQRAIRNQEDCPRPRSLTARFLWPVLRDTTYRKLLGPRYRFDSEFAGFSQVIEADGQRWKINPEWVEATVSDSSGSVMDNLLSSDHAVAASVGVTPLGRVFRRSEPCDCNICKNSRSQIAPR